MPIYQYRCACGKTEDIMRPMAAATEPVKCSACRKPMERVFAANPAMVHAGTPKYHPQRGRR